MFSESSFSEKSQQEEFIKKLTSIQTDIKLSKSLIYKGNKPNLGAYQSEYNQAAYHAVQAIEKSLKLIISSNGKTYDKNHRIAVLLCAVDDSCQQDFIDKHPFLWKNRKQLSLLNEARYDDAEVTKALNFVLLKEAQGLADEIETEFRSVTNLSKAQVAKIMSSIVPAEKNTVKFDLLSSKYYTKPSHRNKQKNYCKE